MPVTVNLFVIEIEYCNSKSSGKRSAQMRNTNYLSQSFGRHAFHYSMIFGNENKDNPTCCGLFTVQKAPGTNTFKYPCTFFIIVLDGEFDLEDQAKPGEQIILKAGDVMRIDPGSVVRWTSPHNGKGFYVAEAGLDFDPAHHLV